MIHNFLDLSPNNFRIRYFQISSECWKNYEAYTVYMLNNFYKVAGQTRGVFRTSEIASRLRNLEIACR